MQVLVCDACKKILEEKEAKWIGDFKRGYDLCEECKEKFNIIKDEYYKEDEELEKQRKELYDKYIEKLKEIGIDK